LSHAVGFAWAAKLSGDDVAALAFFREPATASGDFHTGMNFAGVYRAPAIFFCISHGVSDDVGALRRLPAAYAKAVAYGVFGVRVDGDDLFAVHRAVREALVRASRGEGPTLVEAVTTMQGERSRDPLERVRHYLEARKLWAEADERDQAARMRSELEAAISAAELEPKPRAESMLEDVYAELPWHLREPRDRSRKA
jgi:2-oxoisovalerate dehydrogenase E1 component alpha subunit